MFLHLVFLIETHCLQACSDEFKGVGDGSGEHTRGYACCQFINAYQLQLLVEHVIKSSKEALLNAGSQTSIEVPVDTLLAVDVDRGTVHTCVLMEAGKLESRLYYV